MFDFITKVRYHESVLQAAPEQGGHAELKRDRVNKRRLARALLATRTLPTHLIQLL